MTCHILDIRWQVNPYLDAVDRLKIHLIFFDDMAYVFDVLKKFIKNYIKWLDVGM